MIDNFYSVQAMGLVFYSVVNLNSIVFLGQSMRKQMQKRLNRVFPAQTHHDSKEEDRKISQIIKTFRENHLELIHKIQECDKKRQIQRQMSKKKLSDKYLLERHNFQPTKVAEGNAISRPYSQMKSDRNRGVKQNFRKENNNWDSGKRQAANRSEECEEALTSPFQEQNYKVVKVKMNKLVPLSMDRLKERLKLL